MSTAAWAARRAGFAPSRSPLGLPRRHNPTRICTATEAVERLAAREGWVAETAVQVVTALTVVEMVVAMVAANTAAGSGEGRAAAVGEVELAAAGRVAD